MGASVTYTVTAHIDPSARGSLANTATVALPAGLTDPVPGNNSATDTDTLTPEVDLAAMSRPIGGARAMASGSR